MLRGGFGICAARAYPAELVIGTVGEHASRTKHIRVIGPRNRRAKILAKGVATMLHRGFGQRGVVAHGIVAALFFAGAFTLTPARSSAQIPVVTNSKMKMEMALLETNALKAPSYDDTLRTPANDSLHIPVYYVTTRTVNPESSKPEFQYLNQTVLGSADYGRTVIKIPERLRAADWNSTNCERTLFGNCKTPDFAETEVNRVNRMPEAKWREEFAKSLRQNNQKVLIFVHGFNNDFVDAVTAAAQLAYDVHFEGTVVAFDWTSKKSVLDYPYDKEESDRSITQFLRFLTGIRSAARSQDITIVGHSMGTRLIASAMRDEMSDGITDKYRHIVLAASDIDSMIFMNQLAPKVIAKASFVTMYASSQDKALMASSGLQGGARVGSGPPSVISFRPADYVDASTLRTDLLGHGYYRENAKLLNDLYLLLTYESTAINRQLPTVRNAPSPDYFVLRK